MRTYWATTVAFILGHTSAFGVVCTSDKIGPRRVEHSQFKQAPLEITSNKRALFIVTHAEMSKSIYGPVSDVAQAIKSESDIIYLYQDKNLNHDLFADCEADYYYRSGGGEFNIAIPERVDTIFLVGGNYGLCLLDTYKSLRNAISSLSVPRQIRVVYITDAVYGGPNGGTLSTFPKNAVGSSHYQMIFDRVEAPYLLPLLRLPFEQYPLLTKMKEFYPVVGTIYRPQIQMRLQESRIQGIPTIRFHYVDSKNVSALFSKVFARNR